MFNFLAVFERIGKSIQSELRKKMLVEQKGVDGRKYAPLKPATIRQKMKINRSTARKRMVRTRRFVHKAFQYKASNSSVRVFIAQGLHKATHTFRDLAGWHMGENPRIPPTIFFPQNDAQVNSLKAVKAGGREMEREAIKQAKEKLKLRIRAELDIA